MLGQFVNETRFCRGMFMEIRDWLGINALDGEREIINRCLIVNMIDSYYQFALVLSDRNIIRVERE